MASDDSSDEAEMMLVDEDDPLHEAEGVDMAFERLCGIISRYHSSIAA